MIPAILNNIATFILLIVASVYVYTDDWDRATYFVALATFLQLVLNQSKGK